MTLRLTALLALLAAGLVLVTGAGAGTRPAAASKAIDLSSTAAIKSYLRSIGVNPKSVAIQRGTRNYAGPRCPGKGWTCTTRTRVLQVGSQNFYECTGGTGSGATGGTQTCSGVGVQSGDKNTFRCIERTSVNPAVQDCAVIQDGPSNYALVEQVADLNGNADQDATQTASVEQDGSGKNEVHIQQRIKESTSAGVHQDGHQVAKVIQDATGTAKNFSDLHQYMDLRSSGGASQLQNTEALPSGVSDCAGVIPVDPDSPAAPNQCANVRQTAETAGSNLSHLHQLIDEDAKSSTATTQEQGQESGGIDSDVHQEITSSSDLVITVVDGGGRSENHADQARRQNVSGPGEQIQIDPTRCCGVSQLGGQNNREDINQSSSQNSNANTSAQELRLIGECNTQNGSCFVTHHARNDEDHANYGCGSQNDQCPAVSVTDCESLEAESNEGSGVCVTPDDVFPDLTAVSIFSGSSFLPGIPLSGFEVTMGLVKPDLSVLP